MSLQDLEKTLLQALSQDIATGQKPTDLKQQFASTIATAIDAYVQEQIGKRMKLLLEGLLVPCPDATGTPVPTSPVPGSKFTELTTTDASSKTVGTVTIGIATRRQ